MAANETIVVCDAGPLIHLDELGQLPLLNSFREVLIPQIVWAEALRHRPGLSAASFRSSKFVPDPPIGEPVVERALAAMALHAGERAAIRTAKLTPECVLLTDDAAARVAAESLGIEAHGTIGVLLRALRLNDLSHQELIDTLTRLPTASTLHISPKLLKGIIEQVKG